MCTFRPDYERYRDDGRKSGIPDADLVYWVDLMVRVMMPIAESGWGVHPVQQSIAAKVQNGGKSRSQYDTLSDIFSIGTSPADQGAELEDIDG